MNENRGRVSVRAVEADGGWRVVVAFDGVDEMISREVFATVEEVNAAVVEAISTINKVLLDDV